MEKINKFSGPIVYVNLVAMVIISLLDSLGVFLLIPLINMSGLFYLSESTEGPLSWIFNIFQGLSGTLGLVIILGIYIIIMFLQSIFQRNQTILNMKIQQAFTRHLKEDTYRKLLQANWGFFLNKRKSDITNLMTTELGRVSGGTNLVLQFLSSIVFTIIQIGIALLLSPLLTISVLFFGLILTYFSRSFIKKSNDIGGEAYRLSQEYTAGITEHFNGIKDIKSNNLEGSYITWFSTLCEKIESNYILLIKLKTKSQFLYKIISSFLIIFFVFFSVKMFQAQPTQLMIIIIIFSRLWPRITGIQSKLEQIGSTIPFLKALMDLQIECLNSREIQEENALPIAFKSGIECKNINFKYDEKKKDFVLRDINLQIKPNQMTAIVGRSGAGKSTLIDLLMGLNSPESGEILVDGKTLKGKMISSLRGMISYVPQETFLFNTTIRKNLQIVAPNATEEDIWDALEFSSAAEFVKNFPDGLDTQIGDRGIRLSGGERQRIALARAILRKPTILLLDEATSALDTENERKIQDALEKLMGSMTIIVIAHRLSTIRNADQVIVLDNGIIIQKGGFKQLSNEKGSLFSLLLGDQLKVSV